MPDMKTLISEVNSSTGKKLIPYKGAVIWAEVYSENTYLPFCLLRKSICASFLSLY